MKSNKLIFFAIITIAVILAATMVSLQRAPGTAVEKQYLFPGLLDKVNDVHSLRLKKQDLNLTLHKQDNQWLIEQADNYPADFGKIRETVIAVADLRILSEKTSNSELYQRLGVEDPADENARSQLLTLLDGEGKALATLIVGKARHSKAAESNPGLYVRLPGSTAALLVEGRLEPGTDVKDWFERDLFSIEASRIKNIQISHSEGNSVKLGRSEDIGDFILDEIPDGMEMQSDVIISRMATILEDIRADNVIRADKLKGNIQSTATVSTFDGLLVTIESAVMDGFNYSIFKFSLDENLAAENEDSADSADETTDPGQEMENLNRIMATWAYAIPGFKYELFTRKQADLIKEVKPEEEDELASE